VRGNGVTPPLGKNTGLPYAGRCGDGPTGRELKDIAGSKLVPFHVRAGEGRWASGTPYDQPLDSSAQPWCFSNWFWSKPRGGAAVGFGATNRPRGVLVDSGAQCRGASCPPPERSSTSQWASSALTAVPGGAARCGVHNHAAGLVDHNQVGHLRRPHLNDLFGKDNGCLRPLPHPR